MTSAHPSAIGPDTPLRLSVAVKIAFPDGGLKESGLRREIDRGRLEFERIAGKIYVTLRGIEKMRLLCRESKKAHGSICAPEKGGHPYGSSSTEALKSAQDSARMIAQKLKRNSRHTSPKSTGQNGGAAIQPKSP